MKILTKICFYMLQSSLHGRLLKLNKRSHTRCC